MTIFLRFGDSEALFALVSWVDCIPWAQVTLVEIIVKLLRV
jgi:hypothetical protein